MRESHPDAVQFLDGFAVHSYWNDFTPSFLLDQTHMLFPDKFILNTESCLGTGIHVVDLKLDALLYNIEKIIIDLGVKPWTFHGPLLGSWDRAEEYARNYFEVWI